MIKQQKQLKISLWINRFNPVLGFVIFVFTTVSLTSVFVWLSSSPSVIRIFGYKEVVDFGTAAGAVSALVIGVVSSYLVFVSFQAQIRFNEDQRLLIIEQRRDFEEEKKRTRELEQVERIERDIQYFLVEIDSFSFENYRGSEAIYVFFMKNIRKLRHINYANALDIRNYQDSLKLKPIKMLIDYTLKEKTRINKANELWEQVKSEIIDQFNDWLSSDQLDQLKIRDIDLHPILRMKYFSKNWSDLKSILLDYFIIFSKPFDQTILDTDEFIFDRDNISPKELLLCGRWELQDEILNSINSNHFLTNKFIQGIMTRAWIVLQSIESSEILSYRKKFHLKKSFESLFFSNLSKECLFLYQLRLTEDIQFKLTNDQNLLRLIQFDSISQTITSFMINKFEAYTRFVKLKTYLENTFTQEQNNIEDLNRLGYLMHNFGNKPFDLLLDNEFLCRHPNSISILINSLQTFLEKWCTTNYAYNRFEENVQQIFEVEFELTYLKCNTEELVFQLLNSPSLQFKNLYTLVNLFGEALLEAELFFNKKFDEIIEIPSADLELKRY